jgi:hypothetical protein
MNTNLLKFETLNLGKNYYQDLTRFSNWYIDISLKQNARWISSTLTKPNSKGDFYNGF